ncbi:MAG: methyltransferase [Promethearchaeota archaeon]|nr:MAG: methyltransferase [Candidatus Lokiarchaeota archaeon]
MILQKFEEAAKEKKSNIGIGLGDSEYHNNKILKASLNFLETQNSSVFIFGKKSSVNKIREQMQISNIKLQLKFIECQEPEKSIFEYLLNKSINSIVRGSISSTKFLKNLKICLNSREINRLALLETYNNYQFFYGPVGIDECNNLEKKIKFLELAVRELNEINIIPKISVLSGGRISDTGRDAKVDKTIQDANKIVEIMRKRFVNITITHDEILIEKAIENKSNLIIAPDGISGNLIYRTLVHLGGGKAYGAIYMGLKHTIIDTSRVGDFSEIHGALLLALALSK